MALLVCLMHYTATDLQLHLSLNVMLKLSLNPTIYSKSLLNCTPEGGAFHSQLGVRGDGEGLQTHTDTIYKGQHGFQTSLSQKMFLTLLCPKLLPNFLAILQ